MYFETIIALPEEGSFSIRNNIKEGTGYVYWIEKEGYNKKLGYSVNKRDVLIGKIDHEMFGRRTMKERSLAPILFQPNDNYLEIFGSQEVEEQLKQGRELSYLPYIFMLETAEKIGLLEPLKRHFPDCWHQILALAYYFIMEEINTSTGFIYFHKMNYDGLYKALTTQSISKFYKLLAGREEDIEAFKKDFAISFHEHFEELKGLSRQALIDLRLPVEGALKDISAINADLTNRNVYAKQLPLAKMGRNKSGNHSLKCIGEARISEHYTGIPLYSFDVDGSVPDKIFFVVAAQALKEMNFEEGTVCVTDGGVPMEKSLEMIKEARLDYLTVLTAGSTDYKTLREMCDEELPKNKKNHRISCHKINGMSIHLDGKEDTYHVFYDPMENEAAYLNLEEAAQKQLAKTLERKRYDSLPTSPLVTVERCEKREDGRDFTACINREKLDELTYNSGWFVLRDSKHMSTVDALTLYRRRVPGIENSFRVSKSFMDDTTLGVENPETYAGKRFVLFIAAALRQGMSFFLRPVKIKYASLSLPAALKELKMFRIGVSTIDRDRVLARSPLTSYQRAILKSVGITSKDLEKSISELPSWNKDKIKIRGFGQKSQENACRG